MKTVAFKGRLLLRKILTGLSLGAVTFIFQACYAPPVVGPVSGTVKATDTEEPIPGIQVSVDDPNYTGITDENGWFEVEYDISYNRSVTLRFIDIDGPKNGEFHDKEIDVAWSPYDNENRVVFLDRK